MQRRLLVIGLLAASAFAGAAGAATPSTVFGKWIERYPDGNGLVTEFSAASISSYPVDQTGRATAEPTAMPVTYVDLGGPMLGVSFEGGGGAMVAEKGDDAMTLDFPGIGAHELTRVKPAGAPQSIG
jgi:hypothetical protein